jgi:hypothetical protein
MIKHQFVLLRLHSTRFGQTIGIFSKTKLQELRPTENYSSVIVQPEIYEVNISALQNNAEHLFEICTTDQAAILLYTVFFVDENDVGTYAIKSIDDPRTLNKTIYIRPQDNCLTQNELISKWETLTGKSLEKFHIPGDEFLASMKGTWSN